MGLINVGNRGDFDSVYAPLTMVDIGHPRDAGVTIRIDDEPKEDVAGPVLLWSQLDGTTLTLVFDRPLNPGFHLRLANPEWYSWKVRPVPPWFADSIGCH